LPPAATATVFTTNFAINKGNAAYDGQDTSEMRSAKCEVGKWAFRPET
jgi:hypothetical protein